MLSILKTEQNIGDFWKSLFRLVVSFRMINYPSGGCSGRLIKHLGALDSSARSADSEI